MATPSGDARRYDIEVALADGSRVRVRAIRPDDRERLRAGFNGLTSRSIYLRFLTPKTALTERELTYLTVVDFVRHVALVAAVPERGDERLVGVGRFVVTGRGSVKGSRAEVAVTVAEDYRGRSLGTTLLDHLIPIARMLGIQELEANVLAENTAMIRLLEHGHAVIERSVEAGIAHLVVSIG